MNRVELQGFAGGALQENFSKAFEEVVKNMQDPNTPWKNKRVVTIKLAFSQNEDRDDSTCEISVEKKLAPVKPIATKFALGKDLETGEVFAEEYGKQVKGQLTINDLEEIEEQETENKKSESADIIDFKNAKAN